MGARNKSGSTPAQLVLEIENSSPTTVNLPTAVTTVYDIDAIQVSSGILEILVTTNNPGHSTTLIRDYRYDGKTLTAVQTITQDTNSKPAITLRGSTDPIIGLNSNSGYAGFRQTHTFSPYASLMENQRILIDTVADPSPGTTSVIYSHGYDGTSMGMLLYPDKLDWSTDTSGNAFYVMFNPAGSGKYDMVTLPDSSVVFDKTPAIDFNYWNDFGYVMGSNNCYNYANNRNTMNFAQPGYASSNPHQYLPDCKPATVKAAAIVDGLEFVADPGPGLFPTVPEGKSLVALITGLAPNYNCNAGAGDYHWYRRDRDGNGYWTHKPGWCEVTDRLYPYQSIDGLVDDPRWSGAWNPYYYDTFVGLFLVDSNHEQGMGIENVNGGKYKYDKTTACGYAHGGAPSADSLSAAGQASSPPALEVTIGLYSGLPNPRFLVDDAATIDQIRMAYSQAQTVYGPHTGPKAGRAYMGVMVMNPCGISGLPPTFIVYDGKITARADSAALSPPRGRSERHGRRRDPASHQAVLAGVDENPGDILARPSGGKGRAPSRQTQRDPQPRREVSVG